MTLIGHFDVGSAVAAKQHLWIGRSSADQDGSISVTSSSGDDCYAVIYTFTGVNAGTTLADVIENGTAGTAVNGAGTGTTVSDTGVATLGRDRLACNFGGINDDNAAVAFTGETGGDWTVAADAGSFTGTDGEVWLQTAAMPSAGTIDGGTFTMASDAWGGVGFALVPPQSLIYNPNPQAYLQLR
jgi:hypothetical protein